VVSPQTGQTAADEQNQSANLLNVPNTKFRQKTPLINRIAQLGTECIILYIVYYHTYIVCAKILNCHAL